MSELELIDQLHTALNEFDADTAWSAVQRIEGSLELDPRYSTSEKKLVEHIKSQVSDIIRAKREGLTPHIGSARATIGALATSIKKRTTGPDGWPLA